MSDKRLKIVLYHSVVCPRCAVSKLVLRQVLKKYPGIELEKVELLANMSRARQDGVKTIPALTAQGRMLGGVLLTPGRLERFIDSLESETPEPTIA